MSDLGGGYQGQRCTFDPKSVEPKGEQSKEPERHERLTGLLGMQHIAGQALRASTVMLFPPRAAEASVKVDGIPGVFQLTAESAERLLAMSGSAKPVDNEPLVSQADQVRREELRRVRQDMVDSVMRPIWEEALSTVDPAALDLDGWRPMSELQSDGRVLVLWKSGYAGELAASVASMLSDRGQVLAWKPLAVRREIVEHFEALAEKERAKS